MSLLLLLLPPLLVAVAAGGAQPEPPFACPPRSWCLPASYCDPEQVVSADSEPPERAGRPTVCGATLYTGGFVCCRTQELLPNEFLPTLEHWHYRSKGSTEVENFMVVPWEGHPLEQLYPFLAMRPHDDRGDGLVEAEDEETLVTEPVMEPWTPSAAEPAGDVAAPAPRICPPHSMCVHWSQCDARHVLYEVGEFETQDFLCGGTDDSETFVCCGRLLCSAAARGAHGNRAAEPVHLPGDVAEVAHPPEVASPHLQPLSHLPPPPTPLQHFHDAFSLFSPPPTDMTATPPTNGNQEHGEADGDQKKHYLDKVLLHERRRREVAGAATPGEALRRRPGGGGNDDGDAARQAAGSFSLRSTLGGRLRPAGSGGPVKLGHLPPPPPSVPSIEQDENDKVPVLPPPAAVAAAAAVTPRSVAASAAEADVRPLPAAMWRGDKPTVARTALVGDENEDDPSPGGILSQILDSLPETPDSRHHRQWAQRRGELFSLFRPQQPAGARPPFPAPGAPHAGPGHHRRPPPHAPLPADQHRPAAVVPHEPSHPPPPLPPHPNEPHQRPVHADEAHVQRQQHPAHASAAPACGRRSQVGLHARITTPRDEDGVTAYGEYPWHVAVLTADLTYLCAGALVAPRLALTVAHCVESRAAGEPLVARVGDWDLAAEDELYPAYDVEVVRTVVHPDYYAGNLQNDLALLLLDPPVEGLPHVRPACLPPPRAHFDRQRCWVPGWGQARHVAGDVHDPASYSWRLREAAVMVVAPHACRDYLRTTHLGPFYQLPRRGALCALGRDGNDACFGDGGGAVVCPLADDGTDGPLYAAGLVSWGIGCGQDIPAVYTRVSDYHDWILSHLDEVNDLSLFQYARGAAGQ